jgi:hypothetical protein
MSNTLPPLILPVIGDATGLTATLTKVQQQVGAFGSKLGASMSQQATGALKNLGNAFQGLVAPMLAAGSAYLTFSAGMEALNRADALGKAATSLGITAEKLQELHVIARQTGGSTDGMNQALREMSRTLAEAEAGEAGAVESLMRLGMTVADFKGMRPDESFVKIADAMSRMESSANRLQVSQEIFGRGSRDIAETLTVGKRGFDEIAKSANDYGMIMSDDEVRILKDMNDQIEMMKMKMEAMVSKSMLEFKSTIEYISRDLTTSTSQMGAMQAIAWVLAKAFQIVYAIVQDTLKVFTTIGSLATAFVAATLEGFMMLVANIGGGFKYLYDVAKVSFGMIGGAWDFYVGGMKLAFWKFIELFQSQFAAIAAKLGPHLTKLGDIMRDWGVIGGESMANLGQSLEQFAGDASGTIKAGMDSAAEQVTEGTKKMSQTIKAMGDVNFGRPAWAVAAANWFGELREEAWDAVVNVKSSITLLIQSWAGMYDKLDQLKNGKKPGGGSSGPSDSEIKANMERLEAYKKFLADMDKLSEESAKAKMRTMDPMDAEQERYDAQLAAAEKFHDAKISSEEAYQAQLAKIEQTHADKRFAIADKNFEKALESALGYREITMQDQMTGLAIEANNLQAALDTKLETIEASDAGIIEKMIAMDQAKAMSADAQVAITERQTQLESQAHTNAAMIAANVFGQAAALMDKNNKAQFYAWKAFASGQAIINAFLAYGQVLATPLPDAFGAYRTTMANITLGLGLASAAKIAATPFGGGGGSAGGMGSGGGGGGGGGGGNAANAARDKSMAGGNSNVNVTLYGESFSGSQVRGMISAINDAAGDNMNLKVQVAQ